MAFWEVWLQALGIVMLGMSLMWGLSVRWTNVSIVDWCWGTGFVICAWWYEWMAPTDSYRGSLLVWLVTLWGLRLSIYIAWRNHGKDEDFRYQEFRRSYGPERYWWVSFFQVFLLQGVLIWLISAPLLAVHWYGPTAPEFGFFDLLGLLCWGVGFVFEAGGDWQLARFKADPANKGKVLDQGFWRYTRHPNYFGDSAVWWGYGFLCLASGSYWPALTPLLMTALIIRVSGVMLLEKTLVESKPQYRDYVARTNAFFPWFPKPASASGASPTTQEEA
jgi:steroid 5-alpha reductase family enzyme